MSTEIKKIVVIYHKADFDGLFCREIARKFLGNTAEYVGWDYGDTNPVIPIGTNTIYMLDISVEGLMGCPNLIWIDHHKSAMEKYGDGSPDGLVAAREDARPTIKGYRIDGVAACRLAWQWFVAMKPDEAVVPLHQREPGNHFPTKSAYVNREVSEPLAVRLAGEYDIWDKRDPRAELFQHGLRSCELTKNWWGMMLDMGRQAGTELRTWSEIAVDELCKAGQALQYAQTQQNESIIKAYGFTVRFEGLTFLACNHARFNLQLFTAGILLEHDALLGFNYDGSKGDWRVRLYHAPGQEQHDLSKIAMKYGGGGHKGACRFRATHWYLEHGCFQVVTGEVSRPQSFRASLVRVINCYNQEGASGTPDFILADYLERSLAAYNVAVLAREDWHGGKTGPVESPIADSQKPMANGQGGMVLGGSIHGKRELPMADGPSLNGKTAIVMSKEVDRMDRLFRLMNLFGKQGWERIWFSFKDPLNATKAEFDAIAEINLSGDDGCMEKFPITGSPSPNGPRSRGVNSPRSCPVCCQWAESLNPKYITNHHPKCPHYNDSLIDVWTVEVDSVKCTVANEEDALSLQKEDEEGRATITKGKMHREVLENLPEFDGF